MSTVQVALLVEARALDRSFDYLVPPHLADAAPPGAVVVCPLRGRTAVGVVVGDGPPGWTGELAELTAVVADVEPLPAHLRDLAAWMARYYAIPLATSLRLVLPAGIDRGLRRSSDGRWTRGHGTGGRRMLVVSDPVGGGTARQAAVAAVLRERGGTLPAAELCRIAGTTMPTLRTMAVAGLVTLGEGFVPDEPLVVRAAPDTPPEPTAEQAAAVAALEAAARPGARLLHGVTGSGKTEVYLRLIEAARAAGRTALVLVPEIALTPQLAGRLAARLGPSVAVWHSGVSPARRAAIDAAIRRREVDVVLGARSAVFAPLPDLGVVIVDEEHDASYKQDAAPRYDARQVAWRRAMGEGALVVYGSATPRPETWHALERVSLTHRADGAALPRVRVVDMRTQPAGPVSRPLAVALRAAADRGEKAVLLLNRRGLARQTLCRACGWIGRCPNCDVPLVVHDRPAHLVCHHCGHDAPVPALCPSCGGAEIIRQGAGTQGLEEALGRIVPGVRLVRLDADAVARPGELERRLARFTRPGAAVLLGTQMVAKGHDLPDVTVAAVLDADGPLQQPDFRAEERAFGLIVQLAGRAGRRGEPAIVVVQAWEPDGRAVRLGARHAVEEFLAGELERRAAHGFPPFGHLVRVVVEGEVRSAVEREAAVLADGIRAVVADARVSGPARLHRLRGRTRRAILVRGERAVDLAGPIAHVVARERSAAAGAMLRASVDVDPQET